MRKLSADNFDVMLLDLKLPGVSGMDVLKKVRSNYPEITVIVVTASGDAETAVEAMKNGAIDYITKPFELENVNSSIKAALKAKSIWSRESTPEELGTELCGEEAGWTCCLDDIAKGVHIRLNSLIGDIMTSTVIEKSISIAQSLDIPEDYIARWVEDRRREHAKEMEFMSSLLKKLEANPLAQVLLGVTDLRECEPEEYVQN
jgi:DNA-binding response OmpR family regulator